MNPIINRDLKKLLNSMVNSKGVFTTDYYSIFYR